MTSGLSSRWQSTPQCFAVALFAGLMLAFAATPAAADCTTNGSTVTCTSSGGPQTTPVGTGVEDGLTVNIQNGATIDITASPGATGIDLHDGNVVNNAGRVIAGDNNSTGIYVNNGNTVTNSGTIAVGDNGSAGIRSCCDNVIFNSGTITAGVNSFGIYGSDRTSVTNTSTISVGAGSYGMILVGDGALTSTVTNSGTINAQGGFGIGAFTNYAVVNSGTINAGINGTGIQVDGGNTVTNSGTINVDGTGAGMAVSLNAFGDPTGNTFINTGNILAVNQSFAIFGDSNNTIVNTGVLQGVIFLPGFNNTVTNRGYLVGADPDFALPGGGFIGGTLINEASGTIAIRVTPLQNDRFLTDAVVLNGGRLQIVVKSGLYDTTTIYSPGTTGAAPIASCICTPIAGTFDAVTTSSPFFTATADYSTVGEVNVTLTRLGMGAIPGMTPNQRAVGSILEPGYSAGLDPTSVAGQFYANLMSATSLGVLDQLSGAGTAAAQDGAFTAGGQFGNTMLQQGLGWLNGTPGGSTFSFGAPLGYASAPAKNKLAGKPGADAFAAMPVKAHANQEIWRAWTLGFGGARDVDGQASSGTAGQSTTTFGGAFGIDRQLTPDLLLGFAAGGSTAKFSVSSLSSSGRTDAGHVGAYAVQRLGAAYVAATVNYARADTSTERTITGIGPTENAKGRFASDQLSGRFEIGRKYGFNGYSLTPFAAIEPAALWQRAYTESSTTLGGGPGVLGLSYGSNNVTSLPLFIGAQLDARYTLSDGRTLSPFARLSWVHEFKPERSVTASFVSIPGSAFTAEGARAASDAARIEAGGTLSLNRSTALFANVTSEVSGRSRSIAALGGARMDW